VIIYKNTADFQLVTVSNSLIRQRWAKSTVILLYSFDALHMKRVPTWNKNFLMQDLRFSEQ
jgi:hypothetical protein